jgi:PPM family protein phosphatase
VKAVPNHNENPVWNAWGDTHPGKQREKNEDRIYCDRDRGIFVVVDGMGGEAAGEEAAHHALDCIRQRLENETGTVARRIREAITSANNDVYRLSQARPEWRGMACVLTAAVIENGHVHIGHVGDTRLYRISDGEIRKVTSDHSPVGRREEAGELHELEAMRHPRRNEVYRDVGSRLHKPDDEDFIDYIQISFESDSALLLCSDGLTDMVTSAEILKTVQRNAGNPRQCVRDLIDLANEAGGKDNISVIVAEGKDFPWAYHPLRDREAEPAGDNEGGTASRGAPGRLWGTLTSRWFVFLYGFILGMALLGVLSSRIPIRLPVIGGASPKTGPAPETLVVEPGSAEFPTITKALEKARAGDVIEVGAGEYNDPIRLTKDVSLVARKPGEVVIQILTSLPEGEAAVSADGLQKSRLSGIVIRPGPGVTLPVGIKVNNSEIDISNVEISGTSRAGVWIDGHSQATLVAGYIHSNLGPGIIIGGVSTPRLLRNVIVRNGLGGGKPEPGIQIVDEAWPEVVHNVIIENGAEGIQISKRILQERMENNFFNAGEKRNQAGDIGTARR